MTRSLQKPGLPSWRFRAAIAFPLLFGAATASAQESGAALPQTTAATYQDWTLRCDNAVGSPPQRICEVAQTIASPDGKTAIAQIVFGKPDPAKPLKLVVQLPNGVWLPSNAILVLDEKMTVTATFKRCVQVCFADADVEDATLAALRSRTTPVKLLFADGTRRIVELPVSLNGFAAALDQSLGGSKGK
jgi:invasion protein IalB